MAGNILSAVINVTAPGVVGVFNGIGDSAKKTEATIRELSPQISKLGASLNALKFAVLDRKEELIHTTDIVRAKELNIQIRELEKEIKRLQVTGTNSLGALGSGATKAFSSLRQLAFILPGIGIAGIFNVAFEGLSKFISGLDLLKHSFNGAALDAELFKKAAVASGDDVVRLNALVSVAKDVTLSTNQRKNAISELQKLYPDYLRNISLETINSDSAKKAIDDLTQSIINKALVQEFSTRLAKEIIIQEELHEKVLNREAQSLDNVNQKQKLIASGAPTDAIKKFSGIVAESINKLGQESKEFKDQSEVVTHLTDRLKNLTAASLDFLKTPKPERIKAEFVPKWDFKKFGQLIKDSGFERVSLIVRGDLIPEFHVKETDAEKAIKLLEKTISKEATIKPIPIPLAIVVRAEQVTAALANINATIQQAATDTFANIGETLGKAFAGGNIKQGLNAFVTIIGDALQSIGKQMIALSPVIVALKAAIKTLGGPGLLIGGIALVAIGAALKQSISGIKGFAAGGYTGSGGRNDPAGIVHGGEFVVPAFAVNKWGLPFLNNLAFGNNIKGYADGGFVSGGGISGGLGLNIGIEVRQQGDQLIGFIDYMHRKQGRLG